MINIHWLSAVTNFSISAGIRLRAQLFYSEELKKLINFSIGHTISANPDLIIVGKPGRNNYELQEQWIKVLERNQDKIIILDYIDHYIDNQIHDNEKYSSFYKRAIELVTCVVCSSSKLKDNLSKFTKKKIYIIEDPYEVEINTSFQKRNTGNFFWFGSQNNLKYLFNLIQKTSFETKINLLIQTDNKGLNLCSQNYEKLKKKNISLFFDRWSLNNMTRIIPDISGILIPGNVDDQMKNGVSSNRLLTSFALGRPVSATSYDSYQEFYDYFSDIDDYDKFNFFLKNPLDFNTMIIESQKKIKKYSKENLSKKWRELIIKLV